MPQPLQQEQDVQPIHAQVQEQIRRAITSNASVKLADLRVSFSPNGYTRAMSQTVPGMDPWNSGIKSPPTHYLGMPFVTDRKQSVDVLVQLSDGSPIEGR